MLGGVESILGSQRRVLTDAGYEVRLVAGRGDGEIIPELDSRHPAVESLNRRLAAGDPAADEFDRLRATIEEKLWPLLAGADLVIAHNVMTMHFNLPLAAALAALGRPVLAWTHDLAWTNPRYRAFHREEPPFDLLHQAQPGARYTAISKRVAEQLAETYGVTANVVPNGVDRSALLRIRASTRDLLRPTGALDGGPLVLVPFRVTRRKRLELAIEAIATLATSFPDLRLVISGPLGPHSGDNDAYWQELTDLRRRLGLEGRVVFLRELGEPHPVDDEMIAELYQLASAVLLTSEAEGFGLPVLEAGLARVPVVCSDIDAFREVAGEDAWYFDAGAAPAAIAMVLQEALESRGARLQGHLGARYDWEATLPRIEKEIALALA